MACLPLLHSTLRLLAENGELNEDDDVFDHGAQGADEPGKVGEEVIKLH